MLATDHVDDERVANNGQEERDDIRQSEADLGGKGNSHRNVHRSGDWERNGLSETLPHDNSLFFITNYSQIPCERTMIFSSQSA